jgi:hypothetical protein
MNNSNNTNNDDLSNGANEDDVSEAVELEDQQIGFLNINFSFYLIEGTEDRKFHSLFLRRFNLQKGKILCWPNDNCFEVEWQFERPPQEHIEKLLMK